MKRGDYGGVIEALEKEGIGAREIEVKKNNGALRHGLEISSGDLQVHPVLYLDDAPNIDEAVEFAKKALETSKGYGDQQEFVKSLTDYNFVKDKLLIKLSSKPLEDWAIKTAFLDLYQVLYLEVGAGGYLTITNELFDTWEKDKEEVFKDALENMKEKQPIKTLTLDDFLEVSGDEYIPSPLILLTNEEKIFGAACILYADLPDECIMFPESIHSVIILPKMEGYFLEGEDASSIVKEVNKSLSPEEILSDHAYLYENGNWSSL